MPEPLHCPICHEVGKHAERCPGREPEKPAEAPQTKMDATVHEWADKLVDEIPKPRQFGWKPTLPVAGADGVRLLGPDGRPVGMRSELVTTKSGAEQIWSKKMARDPCYSCEHFDEDGIPSEERVRLFNVLSREAKWDPQALQIILDLKPGDSSGRSTLIYGWCEAHQQATHREASCLRLYQPRKGWLKSVGGKIFGGSKKYGF